MLQEIKEQIVDVMALKPDQLFKKISPEEETAAEVKYKQEAYEEMAHYEEEEKLAKISVLKQVKKLLSAKKYRGLLLYLEEAAEDWSGNYRITDKPATKESFNEFYNRISVRQWSVGDSGDSFEGIISVKLNKGKYFTFDYSC